MPSAMPLKQLRSIPACAGEPQYAVTDSAMRQVYPRVCGGTALASPKSLKKGGLSPRVRGNPRSRRDGSDMRRSIPACAGEPGD